MSTRQKGIADSNVRSEITNRYYRTMTYQHVDRVPDMEMGYWPQTLKRWQKEGMTLDLSPADMKQIIPDKVTKFFGLDMESDGDMLKLYPHLEPNPSFEEKIIERKEDSVVKLASDGSVQECFLDDSDNKSIPRYIKFPVETPDDWKKMKKRYRFDDPIREISEEEIKRVRRSAKTGKCISSWVCGFYGQLRKWMGFENLSCAFYEYPDMVHEMVEHWTELCVRLIRSLPDDIPIDTSTWWEDMAGKNGPFVSPSMFREFLQPGYHRVMTELKKRGCVICAVDSDGNPHDLVSNWLEEGVNIMWPMEVAAGTDPFSWRKEFGLEVRFQGGIDKRVLVPGGKAIDKELERIRPLLEEGGYIPHLDHHVPPDVSYLNFREYLEKKWKLIGK